MPSVQLSQETFERVCAIAAQQGRTPSEVVEQSLEAFVLGRERTPEQRKREWDELSARFDAVHHTDETEEQVLAVLKQVTSEVWAERLARGR
ncbi:MAG: hypothetical protein U0837_09020 [Dehalococcoidia bacterium]|jgi:predicted transcriptional regulator